RAGRLVSVRGADDAAAVEGVDEVAITMDAGQGVGPLPEGWQDLGVIFARAETPAAVEDPLRHRDGPLPFAIGWGATPPRPRSGRARSRIVTAARFDRPTSVPSG